MSARPSCSSPNRPYNRWREVTHGRRFRAGNRRASRLDYGSAKARLNAANAGKSPKIKGKSTASTRAGGLQEDYRAVRRRRHRAGDGHWRAHQRGQWHQQREPGALPNGGTSARCGFSCRCRNGSRPELRRARRPGGALCRKYPGRDLQGDSRHDFRRHQYGGSHAARGAARGQPGRPALQPGCLCAGRLPTRRAIRTSCESQQARWCSASKGCRSQRSVQATRSS